MQKAYLSAQPSSFWAFMTSKALRVPKKPSRKQLNVKVCGSKNAIQVLSFRDHKLLQLVWERD